MKNVLITGCNRGLGKVLLENFAKEGYNIVALIRKEQEDFNEFVKVVQQTYGVKIAQYYADFSSETSLNNALNQIESSGIGIDVLINNAGVNTKAQPIFYMEFKDVVDAFAVNYFAPFLITKRIADIMVHGMAGKGSIINISSTVSQNVEPG